MSNVAGSSTGAVSDLTIEVVKGWSTGRLNEFLKARLKDIDVHIDTITDTQKVDGDSFLELAAVDFERWGVPGGPAKKIERLIKEIQGAHQPLEPNRKRLKTSEALKKTWKYWKSQVMCATTYPSSKLSIMPEASGIHSAQISLFINALVNTWNPAQI
ncbi:unnamed protein product [Rhizophagus irregularis]|nr:unnamed protein product [Rhizophagus irregularis]